MSWNHDRWGIAGKSFYFLFFFLGHSFVPLLCLEFVYIINCLYHKWATHMHIHRANPECTHKTFISSNMSHKNIKPFTTFVLACLCNTKDFFHNAKRAPKPANILQFPCSPPPPHHLQMSVNSTLYNEKQEGYGKVQLTHTKWNFFLRRQKQADFTKATVLSTLTE